MEYLLSFANENDKEDIILYHMLKGIDKVFWIDVGAFDPILCSVTKFFSQRGGSGINIEPQENYARKYAEDRPNDITLNCGAGSPDDAMGGVLRLYGNNGLASFKYSKGKEYSEVPIRTLKDICMEYVSGDIHFLKIDAEGWEKNVLEGMDFEEYRPWIICIEATRPMSSKPIYGEWESLIVSKNYLFAGMYNVNRYYIAEERRDYLRDFPDDERLNGNYDVVYYNENRKFFRYRKIDKLLQPLKLGIKRIYKRWI